MHFPARSLILRIKPDVPENRLPEAFAFGEKCIDTRLGILVFPVLFIDPLPHVTQLKGMAMIRVLLLLAAMTIASGVQAEIFKCKTPSGETEFSDTPCKAGSSSEVVPDNDHVSKEQQDAARAKLEEQKQELKELEAQRAAAEPPKSTQQQPPQPAPVEEVYGGGCYDTVRGRGTNCADTPNRRLPPDRPINRPGLRPVPR